MYIDNCKNIDYEHRLESDRMRRISSKYGRNFNTHFQFLSRFKNRYYYTDHFQSNSLRSNVSICLENSTIQYIYSVLLDNKYTKAISLFESYDKNEQFTTNRILFTAEPIVFPNL